MCVHALQRSTCHGAFYLNGKRVGLKLVIFATSVTADTRLVIPATLPCPL